MVITMGLVATQRWQGCGVLRKQRALKSIARLCHSEWLWEPLLVAPLSPFFRTRDARGHLYRTINAKNK